MTENDCQYWKKRKALYSVLTLRQREFLWYFSLPWRSSDDIKMNDKCQDCLGLIKMMYLQDLPPAHFPAQLSEAVQGANTGCQKHKPPDTTGNSSVTGKSHSGEELTFGSCFARDKSKCSFRAQHIIQEKFVQTNWLQKEVVSLIPLPEFPVLLRASHKTEIKEREVHQGDPVSRTLEKDSTFHWLLVSESPVKPQ